MGEGFDGLRNGVRRVGDESEERTGKIQGGDGSSWMSGYVSVPQ